MRVEGRRNQGGTFIREEANGLYRKQKKEGIMEGPLLERKQSRRKKESRKDFY